VSTSYDATARTRSTVALDTPQPAQRGLSAWLRRLRRI
jgi:hypothetical protein